MTDAQFLALIGLGAAAIAAVPPSIIAWSARTKVVETVAKVVETAAVSDLKANTLIEETGKIHTLANSKLSMTASALDVANAKIEGFITAQQLADKKVDELQRLVETLVEREAHVEKAVNETNGILRKSDSGPLSVQDDQLASKIDRMAPKIDQIQDTVDEK